ncbi:MAG: hypothetical protein AAFW73_25820 [Bacteroidota bacterium]
MKLLFLWKTLRPEERAHYREAAAAAGHDIELVDTWAAYEALPWPLAYDAIYLSEKLDWWTAAVPSSGFAMVRELRERRFRSAIRVVAFEPRSFFEAKHDPLYQILRAPGHTLISPYDIPTDLQRLEENHFQLSDQGLLDIKYYFYHPIGRVEEIFHNLKNLMYTASVAEIRERALAYFEEVIVELPEYRADLQMLFGNFPERLRGQREQDLLLVEQTKIEVLRIIGATEGELIHVGERPPWLVLFVDDDAAIRQEMQDNFTRANIVCLTAPNAEQAFDLLRRDYQQELRHPEDGRPLAANSITVLLTDLRFYREGSRDWQTYQGYDLINEVWEKFSNFLSFFLVTSKKGAILKSVRERRKVNITAFSKSQILQSEADFNRFLDKVREEGESIYEAIHNRPVKGYWNTTWKNKVNYPYGRFYRYHRMSSDYLEKEREIDEAALYFIEAAELVKDKRLPNFREIRDLPFKPQFMTEMKEAPHASPKAMEKFYTKLIGRRIALGLFARGWDINDIASVLKDQKLESNFSNTKQLFNSYLSLSRQLEKDLEKNLLVEEMRWLEAHFNCSPHDPNRHIFQELTRLLNAFGGEYRHSEVRGHEDLFERPEEQPLRSRLEVIRYFGGLAQLAHPHLQRRTEMHRGLRNFCENEHFQASLKRLRLYDFFQGVVHQLSEPPDKNR